MSDAEEEYEYAGLIEKAWGVYQDAGRVPVEQMSAFYAGWQAGYCAERKPSSLRRTVTRIIEDLDALGMDLDHSASVSPPGDAAGEEHKTTGEAGVGATDCPAEVVDETAMREAGQQAPTVPLASPASPPPEGRDESQALREDARYCAEALQCFPAEQTATAMAMWLDMRDRALALPRIRDLLLGSRLLGVPPPEGRSGGAEREREWTKDKPTETGWYWVDWPQPRIEEVSRNRYGELAIWDDTDTRILVSEVHADIRWSGPILLPVEPAVRAEEEKT